MWEPERRESERYPKETVGQQVGDFLRWFPAHPSGTAAILLVLGLLVLWRLVTPGIVRLGDLRPGECLFVRTASAISPLDPGPGPAAAVRAALLADGAEPASCDSSHSHEVAGIVDLESGGGAGPGASSGAPSPAPSGGARPTASPDEETAALLVRAEAACAASLPAYLGLPAGAASAAFVGFAVVPDERASRRGARVAVCLVTSADGRFLTAPARGSGR